MSLFRFDDIDKKDDAVVSATVQTMRNVGASNEGITEIIELVKNNQLVTFLTNGKWSVHQLIVAIFMWFGKGKLSFTTWGLSEPPLRALQLLKEQGYITHLQAILDHRIRERQPIAYQFFLGIADEYGFAKSHAKGYFIETDTHKISIIITANLNRNTKNEFGCVIIGTDTFDLYHQWITRHLQTIKE